MVAENFFVQTSGTMIGTGSHCVSMAMVMVQSGTGIFVPANLSDLK